MLRFLKISLALSFTACAVHADEQPAPKALPDELKQLHGYWVSGPKEFSKDLKGHLELRFEFKGDSAAGLATLAVVPEGKADPAQDVGPLLAEVKEKDKKRVIIIKAKAEGKFVEAAEITWELAGDKLKLTCAKKFRHPELGAVSVELSGEWKRTKPEKK